MQAESAPLNPLVSALRARHNSRPNPSLSLRKQQLKALQHALGAYESAILEALHEDLHRPALEAYMSELGFVLSDISYALRHLAQWVRPHRRRAPLIAWPAQARILPQPYGVVLIIGPWNYPFQLLFSPLVSAIAAGNCVCLKPSELAPHTAGVIAEIVRETFPPDYVTIVEGQKETVQELIRCGFDFLFFTGSTRAGREVMEAASRTLTPVTLELGGKNTCIVCRDAKIDQAARRIVWGKFLNAGQTCVAPDYVLVDSAIKSQLVSAMKKAVEEFYGPSPQQSPDYGRIINLHHFERLLGYLEQGHIACGGEHDEEDQYIAPTIVTDVSQTATIMQEEIFGPILPVIGFSDLNQVFSHLAERPAPLALYLFTEDSRTEKTFIETTVSGGVCINDTISHILGKDLPFGGVGPSGMGQYRGKAGFDCFTHYKSVLRRSTRFDPSFRYPPVKISMRVLRTVCRLLLWR